MRRNSLFARVVAVCLLPGFFLVAEAVSQNKKITEGSLRVIGVSDQQNKSSEKTELGLCPLKNTDVKAEISGFISRVTVTQTFQNPFDDAIEAVYTFPLPNDAAVDDMTITVGERVVKGKIMERRQAQETYEKAKQEGKVAALLEQQRPNIFTQSIANITPNAEIKVVISYVETLKYADDAYEFRFPMTVGERYIPSSVNAADAAKISPKSKTRPAHTISLEMTIDAGVSVEKFFSYNHEIEARQISAGQIAVRLKDENEIPNRDFVFRYQTAGTTIEDAILTHKKSGAESGFFALILQPPDKVLPPDTMPKEIVFVLDTSGSMEGYPIKKAKEAMNLTLDNLNPQDTFNLITFAGDTRVLFEQPVAATEENLARARKWLNDSESGGGTEMMKAIQTALAPSDSNSHVRIVCFMTDGYVGNEAEIIAEVQKHPNARIFAFGIGDSVNHYLLDEISREGRGEVEYVGLKDNGSVAARRFYERIRNPLLTDVTLEFRGLEATEILPRAIPDLFDTKPVAIVGRYARGGRGTAILRGKMRGQPFEREIAVEFPSENQRNDSLASLWARRKVADLTRRDFTGVQPNAATTREDLQQAITALGLEFRLMTPFTSFVAVDEAPVTDGSPTKSVEVPVAAPNTSGSIVSEQQIAKLSALAPGVQTAATYNSSSTVNTVNSSAAGAVGGVTAMVEVVSSSSLETASSTSTTTVTTREINNLPARGKSAQSLFSVVPGVAQIFETQSRFQNPGMISANGQRPTSNYFTADGLSAMTGVGFGEFSIAGTVGALPNLTAAGGTNSLNALDATAEIVVRAMPTAKEGRASGAAVDFVSKRGTNEFHGSVFETFGHEVFNSNDFFAGERGLEKAAARLNQFGATLGGFLRRDKAWFFGNYEGLRLKQPAFAISETPNLISRQTAAPDVKSLFDAFPLPNGKETAGGFAEFAAVFTNPAAHDVFGLRLDAQPNEKLRIGGGYNFSDSKASLRGDRDFSLNTVRNLRARSNSLSFWSNYTLSPSMILNGKANFTRANYSQNYELDRFGGAQIPAFATDAAFGFLTYDLSGQNSALAQSDVVETDVSQFHTHGLLEWIKNNHQVSAGLDFRRLAFRPGAPAFARNVLFSGVRLDGNADNVVELSRIPAQNSALSSFSVFAQDDWRVKENINLNFGLRWDADFAPKIEGAAAAAAAVNLGSLNASSQMRDNLKNFAPRAAFAFDPFNDGRISIRASVGLYYDFGNSAPSGALTDSYPLVIGGRFGRNLPLDASPTNIFAPLNLFDARLRTPRAWKLLTEYRQEIFAGHFVSVGYQAVFGRELFLTRALFNADPNFKLVRLTNNDGASDYHALNALYEKRFARGFAVTARYTLAKSVDNFSSADGVFRQTVHVSRILSRDRAAADFDARHRASVFAAFDVPTPFEGGATEFLTKNWTIFGFVNARTAQPVNVAYARVNDFGVEYFRPDLISGAPLYAYESIGGGGGRKQINPAAFSIPAGGGQGNLKRNAARGFSFFQTDWGLERRVNFGGETNLRLKMEVFNLFNNKNFADMSGNLGTLDAAGEFLPNNYFGKTTAAFGGRGFTPFYLHGGARSIQFSAKFVF